MSLEEYSLARGDDFESCGGMVTSHTTRDLAGSTLLIEAAIVLHTAPEAILEVLEVVALSEDGLCHRQRYGYRLIYERLELFRYDRDARNHPNMPDHKHVGDRRFPSGPVGFREFVEEAWDWINERRDEAAR